MPGPITSDTEMEKTLADLAHSSLADKAPAMLDYILGFQVLYANDDQSKAVGIFGCKVGSELIYLPVFFMNGQLKGNELMYLKDQDLFVPLEEAWVQYILNRKPYKFGDVSKHEKKDLAGHGSDLSQLSRSPLMGKYSSQYENKKRTEPGFYIKRAGHKLKEIQVPAWGHKDIQAWAAPAMDVLETYPKSADHVKSASSLDIINFMSGLGPSSMRSLLGAMTKNADFGNQVLNFYPIERFQAVKFEKKAEDGPRLPDVRITGYKDLGAPGVTEGMTDAEKTRLLKGELVVKDQRDNTSRVLKVTTRQTLETPTLTGIYKVLAADGEVLKCFICMSPISICKYDDEPIKSYVNYRTPEGQPHGAGRPKRITVVNMDGEGVFHGETDKVFATIEPSWSFGSPFGEMSKLDKLDSIKEGECYVIVGSNSSATDAFRVCKKQECADGSVNLYVDKYLDTYPGRDCDNGWQDRPVITLLPHSLGKLQKVKGCIFVPDNSRVVKVTVAKRKPRKDGDPYVSYPTDYGLPKLADPNQIEKFLWANETFVPVKLYSNGTEYQLTIGKNDDSVKTAGMLPYRKALEQLVFNCGIKGDTASMMLKEAMVAAGRYKYSDYWMVPAEGYPKLGITKKAESLAGGPGAPAPSIPMNGFDSMVGVPTTSPQPQFQTVQGMVPDPGNRKLYNPNPQLDTNVNDLINNAAASGQKEVFDAAVIGGLVKSVDVAGLVEKYIGDLILGMDRVGRIYFLYLQHNDDFQEKYGQEDLVELEDSLKNCFKGMGDLIIYLKQKTVETSNSQDRTKADL